MRKFVFFILVFFSTCTANGQKDSNLKDSYDCQVVEFCSTDLEPINNSTIKNIKINNDIDLLKKYRKLPKLEFYKRFYQMFLVHYYNGRVFNRYNKKTN